MRSLIYLFLIGFSLSIAIAAEAKSIMKQITEDGLEVAIDYSAIIDKKITNSNKDICSFNYTATRFNKAGVPLKMLGFAHVYMGPGPGTSIHGHLGERFIYCIGKKLYDIYYDGVRLDEKSLEFFEVDHFNANFDYVKSEKAMGALYYRKITNPTKLSLYGMDTVQANRNIYEQWLDISENEIYSLLVKNIKRKKEQDKKIKSEETLKKFKGIRNNCTYQVTNDLKEIKSFALVKVPYKRKRYKSPGYITRHRSLNKTLGSVQPKYVYKALVKGKVTKLLVIYPSQDNMRKVFLDKVSFNDSIKLLEVPSFKFKPKYSKDWTEEEKRRLGEELKNYQSPLVEFLHKRVEFTN